MRTRNAKTSPPQASAETPAQETTTAAADMAAAVVQPKAPAQAAAPAAVPVEELAGHGGLYTRRAGVTTLAHRTEQPTDEEKAPQ